MTPIGTHNKQKHNDTQTHGINRRLHKYASVIYCL